MKRAAEEMGAVHNERVRKAVCPNELHDDVAGIASRSLNTFKVTLVRAPREIDSIHMTAREYYINAEFASLVRRGDIYRNEDWESLGGSTVRRSVRLCVQPSV
ncbi:MAG: hypothetical protein JKY23_00385 [Nitrospinaceae bacterium]|nr:hypothetical protein [Nitrospinaceae bacterium]